MGNDFFEQLRIDIAATRADKLAHHQSAVLNTDAYQNELKYLKRITFDFMDTLSTIATYSTRATHIYDHFLTIQVIDELIESAAGIHSLVENGVHNISKRELRYLLELVTKYVIIDYAQMGMKLDDKKQYLLDQIPNSSIEVVERYNTPFRGAQQQAFRNEIKDFYYKACAYVHPSKKQLDEQIDNRRTGNTIGFESIAMFRSVNKLIFRAYDMLLVMIFHGFGHSMSKDVFEVMLDDNRSWKFHKGKYVTAYRKSLN